MPISSPKWYNAKLKDDVYAEWVTLQSAVEELFAALDERQRLVEMQELYRRRAAGAPEPDEELLRVLHRRVEALEKKIEELVPAHAYAEVLRRLVQFYFHELNAADNPEELQRRRRIQRFAAMQWAEASRRRERHTGAKEITSPRDLRETLPRANRPTIRRRDRPASAIALLQGEAETVPIGDRLAKTAREYLEAHALDEVRFGPLFTYLSEVFPDLFRDSPNPAARAEAFRYHLRRSLNKFGLRYERGRLKLDSNHDSVVGEETPSSADASS